ncbi:MAG: alpha/beta hydrolase [Alicyclobacillus herbarius]|nr:alpha/beta hydrolase [Alicyclobacillus herbarius]MCL6632286.1 alpha/beta hydrolase [Alicyclobacillus herbarius]
MWVDVNGVRHFVEVRGESHESVILIHGLGGTSNIWYPLIRSLSRSYQTVSYDLRGSGRSGVGEGAYSIEGWADDLTALMDTLGIHTAHFVAHSMGTVIAQALAVRHPARCKSLTLLGPIIEFPPAGKEGLVARAAKVREGGMEAVVDTILESALSLATRGARPEIAAGVREILLGQPAEGYARSCEAIAGWNALDARQVRCPALMIAGSEDNTSPLQVTKTLSTLLSRATVRVIHQCGHWMSLEYPGLVERYVLEFLTGLKD